jgi:hypothetical protein
MKSICQWEPPHELLLLHLGLDASNNPVFNYKNYYGKSKEWVLKRKLFINVNTKPHWQLLGKYHQQKYKPSNNLKEL